MPEPIYADVQPYDSHDLWNGSDTSEPIELRCARMEATARWYASRCPDWVGQPEFGQVGDHFFSETVTYPLSAWAALPPVEYEIYCMRLSCNWGVVMKGDNCKERAEAARDEHAGAEADG